MKAEIGGKRLGSGNKQEVSLRNYERSTHDLSEIFRTSMSCGTLVPFLKKVALPEDTFDIELDANVLTLPTIGPLFGSAKVQLDVFSIPMRLYNGKLHQNKLGIGMDMKQIKLPIIELGVDRVKKYDFSKANAQINTSCVLRYLGMSGVGAVGDVLGEGEIFRNFNGVGLLAYWDIIKNYYANKQEEKAYVIHTDNGSEDDLEVIKGYIRRRINGAINEINIFNTAGNIIPGDYSSATLYVEQEGNVIPDFDSVNIKIAGVDTPLTDLFTEEYIYYTGVGGGYSDLIDPPSWISDGQSTQLPANTIMANFEGYIGVDEALWIVPTQTLTISNEAATRITLKSFDLKNIDTMRDLILSQTQSAAAFQIGKIDSDIEPYNLLHKTWGEGEKRTYSKEFSQEGLAVKTYQSDLFNNWIDTEFINGDNGVNAIAKVSTVGDEFTIDTLNLTMKVYKMLNRIAVSGGSYDDWLDAVYDGNRRRSVESPVYMGGLIKELAFEEVVSNSESVEQPLGTLAGRGKLTGKHKGGKVRIKVDEPSYIIGIASITPRIDYSQGNDWDTHLLTIDDLHKPALDAIGFQELITEQMLYSDTLLQGANPLADVVQHSIGKQPAWINYMTSVNKTYGNFADEDKEMFMTFNRKYEPNSDEAEGRLGELMDGSVYIDPVKYNQIFAETNLDSQNYWVQIKSDITARRKMSAKVIPNL